MRVALVHYWLVGMRGGEKVLEALCEMYPEADIFTLVADPSQLSDTILKHRITTSFLQRMGGRRFYKSMLPLMPFALESFDLTDYDLVISSESGPAKGIIPRPDAVHICYCHSPMRYIWDLSYQYRQSAGPLARAVMSLTSPMLRQWDVTTAARVDHFIANSSFVASRINKYYRRDSSVINPPVDTARFAISHDVDDYFLCAGQITAYKKIEIAIEAFTRLNLPLVVAGNGVSNRLKAAAGPNIRFVGSPDDAGMAYLLQRCRALVYPGVEDFGIIPIEAMASGRPVIAYGRGGAAETVIPNRTGILFDEQSVGALEAAVRTFLLRAETFDPPTLRQHALTFGKKRFIAEMQSVIGRVTAPVTANPELGPVHRAKLV